MEKGKLKSYLDFIPLLILTITACLLLWARLNGGVLLQWQHIVGLCLLPVIFFLFWKLHKLGVVAMGLTLVLGLVGLLSFSPEIVIAKAYWSPFDFSIPIFYGQPIFLVWLLIHFILSGRHYVGIATKKYWNSLMKKQEVSFD